LRLARGLSMNQKQHARDSEETTSPLHGNP